jgi:uncharacterized protein with PIN domain
MGYWDTSCLAKLFLLEAHSLELRAHVAGGATVVTSDISRMELWVTLRRQEQTGTLRRVRQLKTSSGSTPMWRSANSPSSPGTQPLDRNFRA